jgi:KUP system potassium uptake protein
LARVNRISPDLNGSKERLRIGALIGVLGVVYGDIGTSPLYALQASLGYFTKSGLQYDDIFGVLSLIFWALIITVTLKYVTFVMRADNHGEGGILALMALAQRVAKSDQTRSALGIIGIVGAGLFFGDGMITPAISVLSAVAGLEVVSPNLSPAVDPISLVVIVILFLSQRRGTGSMGRAFGPVMTVWFLVIGLLGLLQILHHPFVLKALIPTYGFRFILRHDYLAFIALGAVVLAVTGAEALYADMSHFGRRPIRAAWTYFVLPCLLLNYFGQGALSSRTPRPSIIPFYKLAPHALQLPLVVLSTLATIIASQAVITGAFSMARNASSSACSPAWRCATPARPRKARSTSRRSTPCSQSALFCWSLPSKPAMRWPGPTASPSPARSSAPTCWPWSSSAASSAGRARRHSACSAFSASSTSPSSPPTR